jgi:hypothetical protein
VGAAAHQVNPQKLFYINWKHALHFSCECDIFAREYSGFDWRDSSRDAPIKE